MLTGASASPQSKSSPIQFGEGSSYRGGLRRARLGHVSRARMTQIMGLLNLAPDIQEEILFLPKTVRGRDPISAREETRSHRELGGAAVAVDF